MSRLRPRAIPPPPDGRAAHFHPEPALQPPPPTTARTTKAPIAAQAQGPPQVRPRCGKWTASANGSYPVLRVTRNWATERPVAGSICLSCSLFKQYGEQVPAAIVICGDTGLITFCRLLRACSYRAHAVSPSPGHKPPERFLPTVILPGRRTANVMQITYSARMAMLATSADGLKGMPRSHVVDGCTGFGWIGSLRLVRRR